MYLTSYNILERLIDDLLEFEHQEKLIKQSLDKGLDVLYEFQSGMLPQ